MYKFERFKDPDFKVYSSVQRGTGELVTPHFHESAEVIFLKMGSAEIGINTKRIRLKKGDIAFIPPFCVHSLKGEAAEIVGIVFSLSLITPDISSLRAEQILCRDTVSDFVIDKTSDCYIPLKNAIISGREKYLKEGPAYKLKMLAALLEITAILSENYLTENRNAKSQERLAPVFDYIEKNFAEDIPISSLSRLLNVCDDHFIRLFKNTTNKSPVKYINDVRIEKAMKLLINTDQTVAEIAYKTGFSDQSYMTRCFKSALKTTPVRYRKSARIKSNP